jgi:hypothetical protein
MPVTDDPLQSLPRELPPPIALRQRVLRTLRARGLAGAAPMISTWLRAVAAVALFAGGVTVGRVTMSAQSPATEPPSPRFALLLYEPAGFDSTVPHDSLAAEYGAWAASLGAQFVAGDAFGDSRTLGGDAPIVEPTGFFVINAANYEAAMTVARACPHLRHGGVVSVRSVPTS